MQLINLFIIFLVMIFLQSCAHTAKDEKVCPNITIHSKDNFKLSDTEKLLICGDPDSIAYKIIPSYQASYMLTGFLQSRGYSSPRFEYSGDHLNVYPEEKSYLTSVVVNTGYADEDKAVEKEIMRHYKKELITPKLLDSIEAEGVSIVRNHAYPCAKIESSVDASKGEVTINIEGMEAFQFGTVLREPIEGVDDRALARFYPFIDADFFSEKKLTLAEKRFIRSGIVQGTYFQEKCDLVNHKFSLTQQFIPGNAKTIRLGIGASTEIGPMIKARWSNQRAGSMASLLEASAQLSFKNQYFNLTSDRYMWPETPRRSLLTTLELERDKQSTYEESSATLKPHIQWTRDGTSRLWTWSMGPTLIASSYVTNQNDGDTKRVKTGALEGLLQTKNHDYELYDLHPQNGDFMQFNFDFRHPAFGFIDPLLKLDLTYLRLMKIGNLGKGEAIAAVRVNTSTTWVKDTVAIENLPPSVKFYGGGSDDVRGFKLSSLPGNNGIGSLTKFSLKFEFRKTYVFTPSIESFSFVDFGFFGDGSWELEDKYWYSPGTGIRWLSPIGMVQGYVSRGLSNRSIRDEGNFFYLGLGGVF